MFSTTEITSHEELSDNVIHQRLFFAYEQAALLLKGKILELGCGAGRGMQVIAAAAKDYTAIDKNARLLAVHRQHYPHFHFLEQHVPPFEGIPSGQFDTVISFQVIEHIGPDEAFVQEIHRVLKPGGKAILTTPNRLKSLTRNPWHVREYTADEFDRLLGRHFGQVEVRGITGNDKVLDYYEKNRKSVERITRFDLLNLQYRLPRQLLQVPYDLLNRLNRRRLQAQAAGLVTDVTTADYHFAPVAAEGLDLFAIATK